MAHLVRCLGHAGADHVFRVLGAGAQAALQLLGTGRQDEDADQIVARLFGELLGALPVDIETSVAETPRYDDASRVEKLYDFDGWELDCAETACG